MNKQDFISESIRRNYNVEIDTIQSNLFGESNTAVDSCGVRNKEIEIFYLIRKAKHPDAPYIIFFNGGPGIGFSQHYFDHNGYGSLLPDYNLILMDQRGTGYSHKPSNNLMEHKYYSSRYICYDADLIRQKLLGQEYRVIVFGQSFGGYLVRKYLELYGEHTKVGISHGYGVCSQVLMKVNIEKSLFRQVDSYFSLFPEDKDIINLAKTLLTPDDQIGTSSRCLFGKDIIDIFSFYFGLYSFEKIHNIIQGFNPDEIKDQFLDEIRHLGNLILDSGVLNAVVAHIDLVNGISDDELYSLALKKLTSDGILIDDQIFSTIRLAMNLINISPMMQKMERCFANKVFKADPIDEKTLCNKLKTYDTFLYVIGSSNDSITPLTAILDEQSRIEKYMIKDNYKFVISDGNHREWIDNPNLVSDIIKQYT